MDVCRKYLGGTSSFAALLFINAQELTLIAFLFPFDSAAEKYCCPHLDDSNVASRYVRIMCFMYCTWTCV